jgi:hypothetical protein
MTTYHRYGLRLLIALLVIVYTLTNAGRFHIVDEVSLFALTESILLRGAVDANAIAWTQWVNSPGEVLGEFGPDGQVFSKKGPAPALVAGPWYWLLRSIARLDIQIGILQGTLLWNGLVTALTAALLWLTVTRLGYSDRAGLALGLLYGLATIAWPYANHYFGEPLSALSLLTCFYALGTYRLSGRLRWLWLAGLGAALAVATVTAHVVLVGLFALYWLWVEASNLWGARAVLRQEVARVALRLFLAVSAFGAPLLVAGGLLLWYNRVRFGDPFVTGYHFDSGEGFTTPFWQGFWGLIVSPYRGVFWHTPLLLATPIGLFYFLRHHRAEGILIAALTAALVGLYSVWWMWWGGFAWGPRFLVPLTPLWVLVLTPLVEQVVTNGWRARDSHPPLPTPYPPRWIGALLLSLAVVSLVVQLLAVTVNYVNYEIELRRIFPTDEANPLAYGPPAQRLSEWRYSPVIGQLRLIGDGLRANSDLAWLRVDGALNMRTLVIGFAGLSTLLAALWGWWRSGIEPKEEHLPSWPVRNVLPLLSLLVMAAWLGDSSRDPLYGAPDQGYRAILAEVCAQAQPGDVLITVAPYDYHIPMNWLGGRCDRGIPIFGYAPASMEHTETQEVLSRVVQAYDRIWFVTSGLPPNDAENSVERWLAATAYKADDRWFDSYRLVRYATPVALATSQNVPLDMFLNTPNWEQVTIWAVRAPGAVRSAEIMPVELVYQLDTPVRGNLRWFVQLLTPDDYVVALIDTAPAQGYANFSSLPVGIQFVEKVALQLPPQLAPGRYRLIAGLYNPDAPDPNRLLTPTGRDHVDLGIIVIR